MRAADWRVAAPLLLFSLVAACSKTAPPAAHVAADLVLRNGKIHTVDEEHPSGTSIAIHGGRIVAIGRDADTSGWVGAKTRVVDLHGKLVLPAFHDAHVHPIWGGLSYSRCPIYAGNTPADYQKMIQRCALEQPGTGWLYGEGWKDGVFTPEGVPDRKLLDAVIRDRPVAFLSMGGHSIWLNSKGLEIAGITRNTPDPRNGHIDKDARGEPIGALQESAVEMITSLLPPPTAREREDALRYALKYFHSVGIVGFQDASLPIWSENPADLDPASGIATYAALTKSGELKAYAVMALKWENARGLEQIADLVAASQRMRALHLEGRTVKIFIDGVLAQRTAALLEPYADQPGYSGVLQIKPEVLNEAVTQLDAKGFQVHVHAIGDGGVHAALEAFARARRHNGQNDNRHLISHVNLVASADLARFAALGVTPVFQPLWARLDEYMIMTGVRVGKHRLTHMYPVGSLMRAGARVAYGSDWSVAAADPFQGIEVALTHLYPGKTEGEALSSEERITLPQAVENYTLHSAYAIHKEGESGSLVVGKNADLVVVDQDVFSIPVSTIHGTKVLLTLFRGEAVYGDLGAL